MKRTRGRKQPVRKPATKAKAPAAPVAKIQLRPVSAKAFVVKHLPAPPKFVKPKRVHPRRVLPFVREGVEREFHSSTARASIRPHAVAVPRLAAAEDLTLVTDT